ncbi:MAG TPA: M23 family metallopeptidase, partial [Magnetospirillum sp.]|nr:M23 family metallopeptidase [Magnetospirillum sp.]
MRRLAALLLLAASPALADPPRLGLPVDCQVGRTCWIMNYPDTDPSPAAHDYTCRARSYDDHSGTDFALRDLDEMRQGVPVRAAAAGRVVAARDGIEDGLWLAGRKDEVVAARRQCGNRVAIDHGDGWVTDYCHMRRGSLRVRAGDTVAAGQPIGLVGVSGMTDFPHAHMGVLHFASGAKDGRPVDPFTGADNAAGCGQPAQPLWAQQLPYQSGDLYAAGFADHVPSGDEVKNHAQGVAHLPGNAPALVIWGAIFGAARGDHIVVRLTGPDGSRLLDKDVVVDGDQAWRLWG